MQHLKNQNTNMTNMMGQMQKVLMERPQGVLPSNPVPNPREDLKVITTRSGVTLVVPSVPPPPFSSSKEVEQDSETIKDQKLLELANTPLNENCSAVLLNKLPEKLRDTGRFLIPCDFYGLESCMALADLGASINLMPLSVWKTISLPELTPTQMTLELATRTIAYPASVADDVFVQVGKFTFPADFVVVDYDVDPRVPLILGRPFLRTNHALVDVHGEYLTLRVGDEKLVFNVESTSKYPRKHGDESIYKIDILDITCEDHFHEVLNVQKSINPMSGSPTPSSDTVVASLSLSLTPFGDIDFILEEIDTFLASDDSTSPDVDDGRFDLEGDICLIEELLNNEIPNDLPHPLLVFEINETENIKTSIDDPPDLELKDLPPHLEYVFIEGTSKLPVIIAKDLKREEKEQILKVLKSHKRAIAWKIFYIRGIDPNFCTHKILMEDDFKPAVQYQRWVNSKIHEVIKAEVIKFLDAGLIYPISDSPWVSPVHVVPKKEGMTVITNENNELIPTRLVTERLAGNEFYCFLDGFSRYFQIPIDPQDQEKTTFTCPYRTFAYRRMSFGLCNAPGTFQRYDAKTVRRHQPSSKLGEVPFHGQRGCQIAKDLQGDELLHYDAEIELMNLIILSIRNEIFNSVYACIMAKEMWKRVERLMRGTIQNQVDRETYFMNEFDQFVVEPGEALVSVYNRFAQLMNDLERNKMIFPIVTVNTKFLNRLQPEWLKYVTQVRLAKRLTVDS
ncbi:reverse transcriptase domain-containing protein, partial [Tanacetum coccineum]